MEHGGKSLNSSRVAVLKDFRDSIRVKKFKMNFVTGAKIRFIIFKFSVEKDVISISCISFSENFAGTL